MDLRKGVRLHETSRTVRSPIMRELSTLGIIGVAVFLLAAGTSVVVGQEHVAPKVRIAPAWNSRPSCVATLISSAPSTTCAAVNT